MSASGATATALASALVLGVSAVADQRSTKRVKKRKGLSPAIFIDLVRQSLWLIAIVANVAGFALQVVALSMGSLALVQPLLVFALIFAVLISWLLDRRAKVPHPGGRRSTLLMFTGVAAVTGGGSLYTSSDAGATWIKTTSPMANWDAVASSADGSVGVSSLITPTNGSQPKK